MSNHITSGPDKPWYHHLTIDLFARVLQHTLFHPFIAWLVPLCQRSLGAPYSSPQFTSTCAYAALITALWLLSALDTRVAYGAPREVNWGEEVVVITGGASGLGKILAETYGMRGASVAVLDIREPEDKEKSEGLARVRFYQCDVGDADAVEEAKGRIEEDVGSLRSSHTTTQIQTSTRLFTG